jgi:MYXO-CTERM domain-containing protein
MNGSCAALVCGSIFVVFGSASAATFDSKGVSPSVASMSAKQGAAERPVLLASAGTDTELSTRGSDLQAVGPALQTSAAPSPQPATPTLLFAGLIAVLYVALRRRPRP